MSRKDGGDTSILPFDILLGLDYDVKCTYDANYSAMPKGSFDNENGEQALLNNGEHIDDERRNNISVTNDVCIMHSTREHHAISTTTYNINSSSISKCDIDSIVNDDNDYVIFGVMCSRGKRRILNGIDTCNSALIFVLLHKLSDVFINSICLREDETIGVISVRDNVHQLTNTNTGSAVNTTNDNDNDSNANANCNDTRSELSSEYGERIIN